MRHLLAVLFLSLGATACLSPGPATPSTNAAVTPLGATPTDEKALVILMQGADVIASSVDALRIEGRIQPGTPQALKVQAGLVKLRAALVAADAAQRAGNATSYGTALTEASAALSAVQSVIH